MQIEGQQHEVSQGRKRDTAQFRTNLAALHHKYCRTPIQNIQAAARDTAWYQHRHCRAATQDTTVTLHYPAVASAVFVSVKVDLLIFLHTISFLLTARLLLLPILT